MIGKKRIWSANPLNHHSVESWCKDSEALMNLMGTFPWYVENIEINRIKPENVFDSIVEQYGFPIVKMDGVIEGGIYKANNGNNIEDPDPDLYPLALYVDEAGCQYYVYLYGIIGYVAPKGEESSNFATRIS